MHQFKIVKQLKPTRGGEFVLFDNTRKEVFQTVQISGVERVRAELHFYIIVLFGCNFESSHIYIYFNLLLGCPVLSTSNFLTIAVKCVGKYLEKKQIEAWFNDQTRWCFYCFIDSNRLIAVKCVGKYLERKPDRDVAQ